MKVDVTCCRDCPFFHSTLGSLLAAVRLQNTLVGECGCPRDSGPRHLVLGEPGPRADEARKRAVKRLRVMNGDVLPQDCPLRTDAIAVVVKYPN